MNEDHFLKTKFEKSAAEFLVTLHETHHAKISSTADIVEGIESLFSLMAARIKVMLKI